MSNSKLLKKIINNSILRSTSDIHFESKADSITTRLRIDGILQPGPEIPSNQKDALINHIKVLANLDIAEKRRPQDGKIKYEIDDKHIDIRVSTIPTLHGEKIVLRLLDTDSEKVSIDTLGLLDEQKKMILESLILRQGIILLTGPTGSGKTTTIYSMLNCFNKEELNIVTVEDPIEYEVEGINQTQTKKAIDYTFANALRAFLRQDPDIIFIGEIRDKETAEIAIRAALTGHLVLSTLHTNNAVETIVRLMDMGIEPFLLSATLKLIIGQRLVRTVCKSCKNKTEKRTDCKVCNGLGFKGRDGIFEVLSIDDELKQLIHDKASVGEVKESESVKNMTTLKKSGDIKIGENITTLEEVLRVIQ